MKYTKRERELIAQALKASLKFLWDGRNSNEEHKYTHICIAVQAAFENGHTSREIADHVVNMVGDRIGWSTYLEDWLQRNGVPDIYDYPEHVIQKYRKRWVKSMIKEFSK